MKVKGYVRQMVKGERSKCKVWQLRIVIIDDDGERSDMTRVEHCSYTRACKLRDEWRDEVEAHHTVKRTTWTLGAYAENWNDTRCSLGQIAQSTHDKNRNYLKALADVVGKVNIADVKPPTIEAAYLALKSGDTATGLKWSGTSLSTLHNVANGMFRHAVEQHMLAENPLDHVEHPRNDTRERKALNVADAVKMVDGLSVVDYHAFAVSLMLQTGMREEELCGILWSDVSDDAISIRREVTKSAAGVRIIPIDTTCSATLDMRALFLADSLAAIGVDTSRGVPGDCRVVCDEAGKPTTPANMQLWWRRHRDDFGMHGWTLHEFRHTYLSNLAEAGVHPRVMQALAGHASPSTTMRIYTHVCDEQQRAAVEKLQAARDEARNSAR